MAVHYQYKQPIGYYYETNRINVNGETKRFKINMLRANCLWAMLYFFKETDENGKTHDMEQFVGFFNDTKHLRECIKDDVLVNSDDFVFYVDNFNDKEIWNAVKLLAEAGKKVTLKKQKKQSK